MVSEWSWSAEIGILFGVVSFGLTFFLIIAVQYRRYGRFTWLRLLGAGAVSVYLTTLVAYTLLPLPVSRGKVCAATLQLVPFHFVSDIVSDTAGDGVLGTLTNTATLQVVFNVLLFIPLGIIVRGFFSRGLRMTVLIGLATSVLIEVTQYTGIFGLYSCPYRVADVDDVLTNTLGAVIGGLLGPVVLAWMPRERELRAARATPRPVTVWRRWLGMAIDWALFGALGFALVTPYSLVWIVMTGSAPDQPDAVNAALNALVPGLIVFMVPALRGTGASLGQSAVWLAPRWPVEASLGRRSIGRRLARAVSVGGLYSVLMFITGIGTAAADWANLVAGLLLFADFVAVPLTREHGGLSGLITGAVMRDQRELAPEPVAPASQSSAP